MKINFNNARELIGHHMLADGMSPVIDLEKSHGSWLVDGTSGEKYLDLFSSLLAPAGPSPGTYRLGSVRPLIHACVCQEPFLGHA